jgi:hypothetical protein
MYFIEINDLSSETKNKRHDKVEEHTYPYAGEEVEP